MLQMLQNLSIFWGGGRKKDPKNSFSGLYRWETFPSTNQIAWNVYKDEEFVLLLNERLGIFNEHFYHEHQLLIVKNAFAASIMANYGCYSTQIRTWWDAASCGVCCVHK